MTQYREIMRMGAGAFSQRAISNALGVSRNTVASTLARASERKLSWQDIEQGGLTEDQVASILFPKAKQESPYQALDFDYIAKELRKTGVSLQMLWLEYCDRCSESGKRPYMYSQYCELFRRHMRTTRATMHIPRKPGEQVEVDWAGKTGSLKDPATGDTIPVYLFVAAMAYSQYCYAEAFLKMNLEAWITAHIHLFEFLGGVPKTVVPDNLKTGVTKPFRVEPEIQKNYQEMAEHYNTFIMPARLKKARDKPNTEGAVGKFANTLLGKVRNRTFFTLEEFNEALRKELESYNSHQFRQKIGEQGNTFCRRDRPALPLAEDAIRTGCLEDSDRSTQLPCGSQPHVLLRAVSVYQQEAAGKNHDDARRDLRWRQADLQSPSPHWPPRPVSNADRAHAGHSPGISEMG